MATNLYLIPDSTTWMLLDTKVPDRFYRRNVPPEDRATTYLEMLLKHLPRDGLKQILMTDVVHGEFTGHTPDGTLHYMRFKSLPQAERLATIHAAQDIVRIVATNEWNRYAHDVIPLYQEINDFHQHKGGLSKEERESLKNVRFRAQQNRRDSGERSIEEILNDAIKSAEEAAIANIDERNVYLGISDDASREKFPRVDNEHVSIQSMTTAEFFHVLNRINFFQQAGFLAHTPVSHILDQLNTDHNKPGEALNKNTAKKKCIFTTPRPTAREPMREIAALLGDDKTPQHSR